MEHRHPFNLPTELVLTVFDELSSADILSIARVSEGSRNEALPVLESLTLEEKLRELERAADDDNHGDIWELLRMLRREIVEPQMKFVILTSLFKSSCVKAMRAWLTDLALTGPLPEDEWRKNNWEWALWSAMSSKRTEALKLLMDYGAPLSAVVGADSMFDPVGDMSPSLPKTESYYLHHAIIRDYPAAVDLLLARNGDTHVNQADLLGSTPLILAVKLGSASMVAGLLAHNARIDLAIDIRGNGMSALQVAIDSEYKDIVTMLMDYGADIHFANRLDNTALHYAAMTHINGGPEIRIPFLRRLLQEGANTGTINHRGLTPLLMAVYLGNSKPAELLLEHTPVDIDHAGKDGESLLFTALSGHPDCIPILLKHGAEVNHIRSDCQTKQTPLLCAIEMDVIDAVEILLEAGADASISDSFGKNAWDYARVSRYYTQLTTLLGPRPSSS